MKLYISSDIEGTCGITHWDETDYDRGGRWYDYFRQQMSREVAAACRGGLSGGATEVTVKDAHDSARNIIPTELPRDVRIIRGWPGGLYSMVSGLDGSYGALAFTGYHSPAYGDGNPLAHTMNGTIGELLINGARASEFMMHSFAAGLHGVPVAFLSGDAALCELARGFVPGITTVATFEGMGNATLSIHPDEAVAKIEDGVREAVQKAATKAGALECQVKMPSAFKVQVRYTTHAKAYKSSHYPGASRVDEKTVAFEAKGYEDVARFFCFCL